MNRYSRIGLFETKTGKRYVRNVIFPTIPPSPNDIYVITTAGDRYDTLALNYYDDSTLWWIIAGANNRNKDSLSVKPGVQMRIPMDKDSIVEEYNKLNANR